MDGSSHFVTVTLSMNKDNHSPPSPNNNSLVKKSKSVPNTPEFEIMDNHLLQSIKETFTNSSFIGEMTNLLLNSDVLLNTLTNVVKQVCQKQQQQIDFLTSELKEVKTQLVEVQFQMNDHQQHTKRKGLVMYGIPVQKDENTTNMVIEMGNSLGVQLNDAHFYSVHRLPVSKKSKDKTKQSIIVVFLRLKDRDAFYDSRKKCRDIDIYKTVYINEHLTNYNNTLYMYVRQELNKKTIFTRNANSTVSTAGKSLTSQIDYVNAYLALNRPVILCLTETWLDDSVQNSVIDIPFYHPPLRLDRDRHGGGCAVYIRTDFHSLHLHEFEAAQFEILVLRITLSNKMSMIILNVYRSKTTSIQKLIKQLDSVLEEISNSKYKNDMILMVGTSIPTISRGPLVTSHRLRK
ncbi:unnamed protein product, partial [Didymodactylos carnosus]